MKVAPPPPLLNYVRRRGFADSVALPKLVAWVNSHQEQQSRQKETGKGTRAAGQIAKAYFLLPKPH